MENKSTVNPLLTVKKITRIYNEFASKKNNKSYLDVNPSVESAIDNGEPIVALESTIICHGMPYPKNLETAYM